MIEQIFRVRTHKLSWWKRNARECWGNSKTAKTASRVNLSSIVFVFDQIGCRTWFWNEVNSTTDVRLNIWWPITWFGIYCTTQVIDQNHNHHVTNYILPKVYIHTAIEEQDFVPDSSKKLSWKKICMKHLWWRKLYLGKVIILDFLQKYFP